MTRRRALFALAILLIIAIPFVVAAILGGPSLYGGPVTVTDRARVQGDHHAKMHGEGRVGHLAGGSPGDHSLGRTPARPSDSEAE